MNSSIRKARHVKSRLIKNIHSFNNRFDARKAKKVYEKVSLLEGTVIRDPDTHIAVIIHTYYPEMSHMFALKLEALKDFKFDVFISVPMHEIQKIELIRKNFPNAHIVSIYNKGRDILPFLQITHAIRDKGYDFILKLHSKKSPQHTHGSEWATELLDKLLPADSGAGKQLMRTLANKNTALIGPVDNYLPLTTYYQDNHVHIMLALLKACGKEAARRVESHKEDYGFFAGSMFWTRFDAIRPLVDSNFPMHYFAKEAGQLDGTFAHGLERVFSLVPELSSRQLYEFDGQSLHKVAYCSKKTQQWWDSNMKSRQ